MMHLDDVVITDCLIVGSGIAGLSTALSLGNCTVVTKTDLGSGASTWAQGGIAAAIGEGDSPSSHAADTVSVSAGIAVDRVVEYVTAAAPERIQWLRDLGAEFDTAGGALDLGREAGHSRFRIVHANGDATGKEVMRTLRHTVRARPDIDILEGFLAVDLAMANGVVIGVYGLGHDGARTLILARATVLATGGIGQVFAQTTNPVEAAGDGLAMASRAGAQLADLEFVQFHPTALDVGLDPMPLLTEALRGAGAFIVDDRGHRFLVDEHPDAELAPRDTVARAMWSRQTLGHAIFMDVRHIDEVARRFPTAYCAAMAAGIDPVTELMPVSPAAHYSMGGVSADARGRTSIQGLWATGEVAGTGFHGANRLASNSLLEGLVTAQVVAADIRSRTGATPDLGSVELPVNVSRLVSDDDPHVRSDIRKLMWKDVGVERHRSNLLRARLRLDSFTTHSAPVANLLAVATLTTGAALRRTESRGSHHRIDYPALDPTQAHRSFVEPVPVPRTPTRPLVALP